METGCAVQYDQEHIIDNNALQVLFSPRFVYSSDGDFSLVKQMVADNERYKRGILFEIT